MKQLNFLLEHFYFYKFKFLQVLASFFDLQKSFLAMYAWSER